MGTRADFYVGRGEDAEWLGSIAWDGYPEGLPKVLLKTNDAEEWRKKVARFLSRSEDGTLPEQGWPWPWDDSGMTDFAYAIDDGQVWISNGGSAWVPAVDWDGGVDDEDEEVKRAVFPNMLSQKSFTMGPRSGLIVVGGRIK